MMAGKAGLIKDVLFKVLRDDKEFRTDLGGQYKAFREHLIHDIKPKTSPTSTPKPSLMACSQPDCDITGNLHPTSSGTAAKSTFLRNLFGYVAGPTLDDSIRWIIDDLADVFQAASTSV